MASFRVEWVKSAKKDLRKLPSHAVARILEVTAALGQDPFPRGSKKLTGSENSYRVRIGDYRVIYDILDCLVIIEIQAVGHRKDIYRK